MGFTALGAVLGAVLGFLLRPSVPFVGQLPLNIVLTRGAGLTGVDMLLRPTAEQSFNYLIIGTILGAVFMTVAKRMISQRPSPTVAASTSSPVAFCTKCGKGLRTGEVFCASCGARRG